MVRKITRICALVALLVSVAGGAIASVDLQAVGSGSVRYMGLIKVYDATLYAASGATEAGILAARDSFCLELTYSVDLTAKNFVEAGETILSRQHGQRLPKSVRQGVDLLHASYRDVKEGDSYRLCYDHQLQQSKLALNEEVLTVIDSADFASVYFGIWLGRKQPLDKGLRDDLLAGLKGRGQSKQVKQ